MCDPGKLLVRVVWMLVKMPTGSDVGAVLALQGGTLASNAAPVRRCQLQLPQFENQPDPKGGLNYKFANTTIAEFEAAQKSKEVNCRTLDSSSGFPPKSWYAAGTRWLSDTMTFDFAGCEGVHKPGAEYHPTIPYLVVPQKETGFEYFVPKFEVQEVK
jgi:hypothetical protein